MADSLNRVEILLWLVPAAVVTVLAMLWVGWLGREGRGAVDRDVAVRRLAAALSKESPKRQPQRYAAPQPPRDRSTGIAVRPAQRSARGSGQRPSARDRRAS